MAALTCVSPTHRRQILTGVVQDNPYVMRLREDFWVPWEQLLQCYKPFHSYDIISTLEAPTDSMCDLLSLLPPKPTFTFEIFIH